MLRFVSFALSLTAATSLSAEMATSSGSHLDSWIDCIQFFDHMDTLAKAAGVMSPKDSPAFNPMTCEKAFKSFQHTPRAVDAVVNLAHHLDGEDAGDRASRRLARKAEVEDVALKIRQQHAQHVVTTELFEDQSPRDFMRRLQAIDKLYEFDAANSDATEIANCVVPQDQCPHEACVADYLLQPTYVEFPPAYGGTVGYALGTSLLKDNVLAIALLAPGSAAIIAAAIATAALTDFSLFWTGNAEDRTDTGATGFLEIVKYAQASAEMVLETLCEVIPDDIEVTVIVTCIDVPNPIKAACEGVELILKLSGLVISTLSDQAAFQDSLVDGAEVEAAYEHSRSLLHKQCAIFDEARCRCQDAADPAGTIGMGCDGKDSDCNDFVDDCSEDTVSPTIDTTAADECCSTQWFNTPEEAQSCVEQVAQIADDCRPTSETFATVSSCGASTVEISASDTCGNSQTATVPVLIDEGAPDVNCTFDGSKDASRLTSVLAKQMYDVDFEYFATDSCGGDLDVTVEIFSSEREGQFSGPVVYRHKMAILYNDQLLPNNKTKLLLQHNICPKPTNGQCVKDPKVQDARLYTAKITATDTSGLSSESECTLTILPVGDLTFKDVDTTKSTQRHLVAAYTSVFDDY